MDLFTHLGLVICIQQRIRNFNFIDMKDIVLRILAWYYRSDVLVEAYCNVIIVSNILCYIRLTTVFAVSKSLACD